MKSDFCLQKNCPHRSFESFNHTKGLLKHNGFVWNFMGYNLAIMESVAKNQTKTRLCSHGVISKTQRYNF
jgi:hypothetical protein